MESLGEGQAESVTERQTFASSPPNGRPLGVGFGDGLNDHEMLVWAGHGVAMGNAEDATKAIADEVTATNDDDGVAVVMERLLGA